jgi:viroplasmin and RNaseH domain-containing protein
MKKTLSIIKKYNSLTERVIHIVSNILKLKVYLSDIGITEISYIESKDQLSPYYKVNYKFSDENGFLLIRFLAKDDWDDSIEHRVLYLPISFIDLSDEEIITQVKASQDELQRIEDEEKKEDEKNMLINHKKYIESEYKRLFVKENNN